ncbi:MAG: ABC transporter permease [Deltaproteobacteria bacterium]|nr:ABC transporter permease [Deltaproteobacteria bacterium]
MIGLDSWQEIVVALKRNKFRTLLTAMSVFWGVFMLIVMLGLGKGFEHGTRKNVSGLVTRSLYIWSERTSIPYQGLQPGRYVRFNNDDIDAIARISGIEYVAPRLRLGIWRDEQVTASKHTGTFRVTGDVVDFKFVEPFLIERGRYFNDRDLNEARKIAVIGVDANKLLFLDTDPIGKYIQIRGVNFQVVGTIDSDKGGLLGDRVRSAVIIPFSTCQQAFNMRNSVHWFALTLSPSAPAIDTENIVKSTLRLRHQVHPDDLQAIGSFNGAEKFDQLASLFDGIEKFVWFVGMLTLLAGILGVSNILLVTVKKRTREFGIRKALGATPIAIIAMVTKEAIALTSIAGYAGLVAGVGLLDVISRVVSQIKDAPLNQPEVDFNTAVLAVVVLMISGALAGLLPARYAARINPVEALRAE